MVGTWEGIVMTPWTPTYPVTVTFEADGSYRARCLTSGCVAFYYGTDEDAPAKRYMVNDIRSDGLGVGEISIAFDVSGTTTPGELLGIALGPDRDTLSFDFYHRRSYGPIGFRLHRSP
jgi:hypothetical protein